MSVVALRLAGPLQSWGSSSRFVRRGTEPAPTKSGILGMIAAARGMRRTDPITELTGLRFGVRIDQPGRLLRDFHTTQRPRTERDGTVTWHSLPLSYRYYLSDAVFLAVLEGGPELIAGIDEAVRAPHFPLYLGRRSCPPSWPVALGTADTTLIEALQTWPWQVPRRLQEKRGTSVELTTVRDLSAEELNAIEGQEAPETDMLRDAPVSFDPHRREYGWRRVIRGPVTIPNPLGVAADPEHDPMSAAEE